jgi:hypothetical protein
MNGRGIMSHAPCDGYELVRARHYTHCSVEKTDRFAWPIQCETNSEKPPFRTGPSVNDKSCTRETKTDANILLNTDVVKEPDSIVIDNRSTDVELII